VKGCESLPRLQDRSYEKRDRNASRPEKRQDVVLSSSPPSPSLSRHARLFCFEPRRRAWKANIPMVSRRAKRADRRNTTQTARTPGWKPVRQRTPGKRPAPSESSRAVTDVTAILHAFQRRKIQRWMPSRVVRECVVLKCDTGV